MGAPAAADRSGTVRALREQLRRLEGRRVGDDPLAEKRTGPGSPATTDSLADVLGEALCPGSAVELVGSVGSGSVGLAAWLLKATLTGEGRLQEPVPNPPPNDCRGPNRRRQGREGEQRATVQTIGGAGRSKTAVLVSPGGRVWAPGLFGLGLEPEQLVLIRPASRRDALWAAEQALRCRGVGVVLTWLDRVRDATARRLKRAAEAGGTVGLFLRPPEVRRGPCWADLRLAVRSRPGRNLDEETLRPRWEIELLYRRGHAGDRPTFDVVQHDGSVLIPVAAELAGATVPGGPGGRQRKPDPPGPIRLTA